MSYKFSALTLRFRTSSFQPSFQEVFFPEKMIFCVTTAINFQLQQTEVYQANISTTFFISQNMKHCNNSI